MVRWSGFVLGHKRLVALLWVLCLVAAIPATMQVSARLTQQNALPGQPGYQANQEILRRYGTGGAKLPLVPVVVLPAGTTVDSPDAERTLREAFAGLARRTGLRVVSYATTGDRRFVSADGRTTFALVFLADQRLFGFTDPGPGVTADLAGSLPPAWSLRVTGVDELSAGNQHAGDFGVLTLTLVGGLGALLVLAFVFGSLLALLPLLVATVTVPVTFGLVDALTTVTPVHVVVEFMVALIGLGVAIDYSLLLVTRWRDELAAGHTGDEAVARAMHTAGHAVLFSGVTAGVGMLALLIVPVPFLRGIGYGGMLIPLVSVAVTLSLLPVVLAVVGRRLDWPHLRGVHTGRGWASWARGVVRHRAAATLLGLAVIGPLAVAGLHLRLGTPLSDALASTGPAREGLVQLERAGIPTGVLTPMDVLVPAGTDPVGVAATLAKVPGVYTAAAPGDADWRRAGTAVLTVLPVDETGTGAGRAAIARVRAAAGPGVQVGGPGAEDLDFRHVSYGRFPLILAVLAVLTYLLLARPFRSLLLPAKAVLLNLLSVAAVFGAMDLVWQDGYGANLWGVPATGSVDVWIPLVVFAFLYGLSMDYEVFIVTRIREEYDRTGSTRSAVVNGIARTGRLVTSAALILLLAFLSLASSSIVTVEIFATALGMGIVLDATVIRALLVPALMAMFGRANWWLPSRPRRPAPAPVPRTPAGVA